MCPQNFRKIFENHFQIWFTGIPNNIVIGGYDNDRDLFAVDPNNHDPIFIYLLQYFCDLLLRVYYNGSMIVFDDNAHQ